LDDIHVELKSMTNTMDGNILATTSIKFTVSSNTLRVMFPHLNSMNTAVRIEEPDFCKMNEG
ncbi:hypothetical protein PHMEG_00037568, partial [Phytophthora megakarya]